MITRDELRNASRLYVHITDETIAGRRKAERTGVVQTKVAEVRANGRIKEWKTRPADFRRPFKYGLSGTFDITPRNLHRFHLTAESAAVSPAGRYVDE